MTRRISFSLLVLGFLLWASMAFASDSAWTGVISDSHCGATHSKASDAAASCVEKCVKGGSSYVFVNDKDSKVYKLDPQEPAKDHGGHAVTVTGTVEGDTIHVKSITMASK